ncbi:hypothetical protein EYV94_22715 [Puteibacter caeruleilacunae]|nr:hypothetical protein EYV94_22715 [Puteibacter caeruleilacunae]
MTLRTILTLAFFIATHLSFAQNKKEVIDFITLKKKGIIFNDDFVGTPDEHGTFMTANLVLPNYEKGIYYSCSWWPTGANRVYGNVFNKEELSELKEGGMFLLLKISDNKYLSIFPLASEYGYSWFDTTESNIVLKLGHHGKGDVKGDVPVVGWAYGANPYEACYNVWDEVSSSRKLPFVTKLREDKVYPEMFKYLGWCSWEQYAVNINQDNMTAAVRNIEKSGVPVRYFLIDDGFFNRQSLQPAKTFPNGLSAITSLKKESKIKWMGLWYAFLGNNHGVKAPGKLGDLSDEMMISKGGKLLPKAEDRKAADAFYDYLLSIPKESGFDFVKIDFQTDGLSFYAGVEDNAGLGGLPKTNINSVDNPVKAAQILTQTLHKTAEEKGLAMMNCNWHSTINMLYCGNSVVGRCSEDYKVGNLSKAKAHLYHSYTSIPWLGQTAWGDHDMFHSNDKPVGSMMAVSKAISGGPVFLSDDPSEFLKENINPLCYNDGELLRPLAPAAPLPNDLFKSFNSDQLFRVIAPLNNKSAAIVLYNFGENDSRLTGSITKEDYANAAIMLQPYKGKWDIPKEGIFVYDWYNKKGRLLKEEFNVGITGFNDRLYLLVPVNDGWGIIGRTDKYLSPEAIHDIEYKKDGVSFIMKESGPFTIYLGSGEPKSDNIQFEEVGGGLWRANIVVGEQNKPISIKRIK